MVFSLWSGLISTLFIGLILTTASFYIGFIYAKNPFFIRLARRFFYFFLFALFPILYTVTGFYLNKTQTSIDGVIPIIQGAEYIGGSNYWSNVKEKEYFYSVKNGKIPGIWNSYKKHIEKHEWKILDITRYQDDGHTSRYINFKTSNYIYKISIFKKYGVGDVRLSIYRLQLS